MTLTFSNPKCAHARTGLAIEISLIKSVEIGNIEFSDTQARQGYEMNSPYTTHSRYGNSGITEATLLGLGQPADVAGKCSTVIKGRHKLST